MQSLPAEILDMILNGLDANGVPFLDPLWRFAARATHPTWRHVITSAASTETRDRIKAFARAWRVPCSDGRGYMHNCQCAYSPRHGDFKKTIASGHIVPARCAIGRPWVTGWCSKDSVPQQDRAMVALFTLPAPATDVAVVRHIVSPHVEGDESTGPWPVCPLRRDFWCYIERVPPEERGDDAYGPSDSEFLNDVLFFAPEWNRSDIVRSLLAAYPAPDIVETVLLHACLYDDAQLVEYALVHAHRFCCDKGDDVDVTAVPHVRGLWKKAAKSSGAHVLERFLSLCARNDQRDQGATVDSAKDGRNDADCTEADVARMARLARPKSDLAWQKCAARCGNIDALLVGERYGIPIQVHELIKAASDWGNHSTVRWLLKRVPAMPDPSTAVAFVRTCASALSGIVGDVDKFDWTSSAYDQCTCRKRRRSKASPITVVDGHSNGQGDQDGDNCAPEICATIDALCGAMSPMMATDDGIATARRFLSTYLNRDRHTSDGVSMVVRAIEHWRVSVAARIKPLGWGALIRAAVATGAVGAIDRIVDLIAAWSPCDLTGIDVWAIAADHLDSAIRAAAPPAPFLNCGECPKRSLFYKRDRAAAMQSHVLGVVYGTISVGEAAGQTWRALCRPRSIAVATLGDPACDSPPMASLRASMRAYGLVSL
ncbi:hypothetical protein pmac_cds_193 [Pandoravirus macleodensis]|uniref:F-box incomplete domain containing protein n=1 Tax=Pandoravirus macleodensis TaxID=2107707 RepID=A0A2U7UEI6_9VIRU|nr:hypothetical protein pmac_cds_193 [Pandoravirus macleodensis]AVK76881.1 hypothetical protein pmac_cds_193 [Pandoravirus macleodensis]